MAKILNWRFFGCLSLRRTFGDAEFKEYGVNYKKITIIKNKIKYVIESDGIWNIVDNKQLFKI